MSNKTRFEFTVTLWKEGKLIFDKNINVTRVIRKAADNWIKTKYPFPYFCELN